MSLDSVPSSNDSLARRIPLLAVPAVLLLLAHIGLLAAIGHSPAVSVWSDCFELAAAVYAAFACLQTSRRSHGIARPFWYLAAAAFGTWSLGKGYVIYDFDYLHARTLSIGPVLLFFLAAAPLFVAVFLTDEDLKSAINWEWILDGTQILGLILIIYLFLIYIPLLYHGEDAVNILEDRLLLWRNILLSAALLIRGIFTRSRSTRRLYLPVGLTMAIYAVMTWFGNRAQAGSSAPEMSWYDLAWAGPFCLISLSAALWSESSPESSIVPRRGSGLSRVAFAYIPSLLLPILLMLKYREVVKEQIFLGLCGLIFSIVLFNIRLVLTQRRQRLTAEALQATEHQYRLLFERNMAGVFRSTLDGKLIDCNPAFARMFGYSRDELVQTPMHNLYFGGAHERGIWIERLQDNPAQLPPEFCLRRKDGSPLWAVLSANVERRADDTDVLEGTVVDITERKIASLAIEEWKRRYDDAVVASGQIVYESDPEFKHVTLGGCVPEVLGYSAEELSGDAQTWIDLIHPEDRDYYLDQLHLAVASHTALEFEYRAQKRNNGYLTLREQSRSVRDANGKVVRVVGFITDVTERRALELQFRQAQKMEAVGRLAGGIAHDFNNLLTVISGYSSMQLERTSSSDPIRHEAEQIKAAADRAAGLTRQLLAFSRQQVLQPRQVNLNDTVRNVDRMMRRLIGEDVEVMTALAPDLGTVKVDPGQMEQVLMNLVVNARDAMPSGGKLTLQTENAQLDESYSRKHDYVAPGNYVMLAVSDSGTGIEPEIQARIFEPFFTTKEPGKGTGLGLPMVYGIVKQSGGSIEVYSEVNQGTTVKIYLPRFDSATVQASQPLKIAMNHGSESILLVEDDALVRAMAAEILEGHGYTVHSLPGLDKLDAFLQHTKKCDLLLTDVVMPKIKGPELAARISARWPGIKVLYMSGYTTNAIVHHGVLDEGLSFLQKPFTPATLAAKVREVLNKPTATAASQN